MVLLVGTNPLPNYVVSKYLLGQNSELKHLWLVHSEERKEIGQAGTGEYAENIKRVLKEEFDEKDLLFEMVALSEVSSASSIVNDLEKKLAGKIMDRDPIIHLNYTGGTKSMAVHVYRFLENNYKNRSSFSYLDGRRYKLLWDYNKSISKDLRKEISLSLSNLIELHDYKKKNGESPLPQNYYPVLEKFENLINTGRLAEYLSWKNKQIRDRYYSKKGFIKTTNKFLKQNSLVKNNKSKKQLDPENVDKFKQEFQKQTPPLIHDLLSVLPQERSILDDKGNLWIPDSTVSNAIFKERLELTISGFLDGKWLEHYAYRVIKGEIQKDNMLKKDFSRETISIDSNWEIKKPGPQKEFEIDVIIVNGYQICGISCTTSKEEGTCKQKGFEIIHRTRQMGGDEALSVLVTCLEDHKKDAFSADLEQITGATKQNLLVLSISDLKADILWKKIKKYIWGEV